MDSQHDLELLREILAERPFEQPKGSRMIGIVWQKIVNNVNAKSFPCFILKDIRAVQEKYGILERKFKCKAREEVNASGISLEEPDEFDVMMKEIIGLFGSNAERQEKEKEEKCENEKSLAEDTRLKALETIGETRKRKSKSDDDGDLPVVSTKRRATLAYFKEKHRNDLEIKRQEIEV